LAREAVARSYLKLSAHSNVMGWTAESRKGEQGKGVHLPGARLGLWLMHGSSQRSFLPLPPSVDFQRAEGGKLFGGRVEGKMSRAVSWGRGA